VNRAGVPPEIVVLGDLRLRRLVADDAPTVSRAVTESLDHLVPWIAWANPEAASVAAQRNRLSDPNRSWSPTSDYEYGIFAVDDGAFVGACGLHRRSGLRTLEIGYWVHVAHTGRGVGLRAAEALTDIGFSLAGTECMEIRCDAANVASAAIPRRLGYVLVEERECPPTARAESGLEQRWRCQRRAWVGRARARPG
jgi:RimJ/RimL family protein N-acetyltransferase